MPLDFRLGPRFAAQFINAALLRTANPFKRVTEERNPFPPRFSGSWGGKALAVVNLFRRAWPPLSLNAGPIAEILGLWRLPPAILALALFGVVSRPERKLIEARFSGFLKKASPRSKPYNPSAVAPLPPAAFFILRATFASVRPPRTLRLRSIVVLHDITELRQ